MPLFGSIALTSKAAKFRLLLSTFSPGHPGPRHYDYVSLSKYEMPHARRQSRTRRQEGFCLTNFSNDAKDADFKYGFAKEARPLWNERGCSDHALINLDGALPSPQLMGSQSTSVRVRPGQSPVSKLR